MSTFLLVSGDFVTTGGMDRANHALARHLLDEGHEVHLVAHRVAEDLLLRRHVHFHRVPKPLGSYLLGGPVLDRVGRYWARRLSRAGARVLVNGGNCRFGDVNWVHYVHAAHEPVFAARGWRRTVARFKHKLFLRDERLALLRARLIIANSDRTRQDLIDDVGVDKNRVRVIYYGVDPKQFFPADDAERARLRTRLGWPANRPVVAFIGALGDRRKGFDTVLDAWRLLRGGSSDLMLAVIGAGAELETFRQRVAADGLGNSVEFLGFRKDVPDILRASDALVAPTRYEAFGLGVHEAMCCGLPAIVSRSAGVAEFYPQYFADLLIDDPDDPALLASAIKRWSERREHYRAASMQLSSALRARSWEIMGSEFLQSLDSTDEPLESAGSEVPPADALPVHAATMDP